LLPSFSSLLSKEQTLAAIMARWPFSYVLHCFLKQFSNLRGDHRAGAHRAGALRHVAPLAIKKAPPGKRREPGGANPNEKGWNLRPPASPHKRANHAFARNLRIVSLFFARKRSARALARL
jgi:hypothetical protein